MKLKELKQLSIKDLAPIEIVWEDSSCHEGWVTIEDTASIRPLVLCTSLGYCLGLDSTRKYLRFTRGYSDNQYDSLFDIPLMNIVSIKKLK